MRKNLRLKTQNLKLGFTLIELLVVISIIGILATLVISRYGMVEKSARDVQRKSDLNQYRTALENYAVKSGGVYLKRETAGNASTGEPCLSLTPNYLSKCPQDPREEPGGDFYYRYQTDSSGLSYILWAKAETGSATENSWYVCADGKTGSFSGSDPSAECDFAAPPSPSPTSTPTPAPAPTPTPGLYNPCPGGICVSNDSECFYCTGNSGTCQGGVCVIGCCCPGCF